MSYSEPELLAMLDQAEGMDDGEAKSALMEDVVRHADAAELHRLAFAARRSLANAYCVDRRWDKAFPLFSRCLSEYDQRAGEFGPVEGQALRQWYPWIVQSMVEFPEITLRQIYGALDDIERRFPADQGVIRDVLGVRRWLAEAACDWAEEEHCYQRWLAAGGVDPNSIWDFVTNLERLVNRGDDASLARARALAAPALAGHLSFDEPITPIQCVMALPLARLGETAEAKNAFKHAKRGLEKGGPYRFEYTGMLIEYCALAGDEVDGIIYLMRSLWGFYDLHRPYGKMRYATSAAVLTGQLIQAGRGNEKIKIVVPRGEEEPREIPAKKWTTAKELHEQLTAIAFDLAARFDARNGGSGVTTAVRARLTPANMDEQPLFLPSIPRRQAMLSPLPPGLSAEQLLDRAEWHAKRFEDNEIPQCLNAIGHPPAHLSGRFAELRARTGPHHERESGLRQAAALHQQLGDRRRHQLCRLFGIRH
ncbi:MAG: hypothetical protein DLM58_18850, partial [Pseudonocardiales bacterium]